MVAITAFYHFVPLTSEQIDAVIAQLNELGPELAVRGLVLVAPEGINGTVAGTEKSILELLSFLKTAVLITLIT